MLQRRVKASFFRSDADGSRLPLSIWEMAGADTPQAERTG
jgi:hypothetical protein